MDRASVFQPASICQKKRKSAHHLLRAFILFYTISIHFLVAELTASSYFKTPFNSLIRPKQLAEYTVMNIEVIQEHERRKFAGQGAISKRVRRNVSSLVEYNPSSTVLDFIYVCLGN